MVSLAAQGPAVFLMNGMDASINVDMWQLCIADAELMNAREPDQCWATHTETSRQRENIRSGE